MKKTIQKVPANNIAMLHLVNSKANINYIGHNIIENVEQLFSLTSLSLVNPLIKKDIDVLCTFLLENMKITNIDLSDNCIGDKGVTAIAAVLEKNTTVTSINLDTNFIGDKGATALAAALKKNTTVTSINLNLNLIEDEGATALAAALEKNETITNINLASNKIGDKGATALAAALEKNETITNINLSCNYIRDEGVKAIATVLEHNKTITNISLGSNKIGAEGVKAIATVLEHNKTITNINLGSNKIGAEGAKAIAAALERNTTITNINLSWNDIKIEGAKAITEVLSNHKYLQIDIHSNYDSAIIKSLNSQHKANYDKVVQYMTTAIGALNIQETNSEKKDRVKEALKIKFEIIDHLFENEQSIKDLFANAAQYTKILKDNNIATDRIAINKMQDIASFFKTLHQHRNEYFFTMNGVCKDRPMSDMNHNQSQDSKEICSDDAPKTIAQVSKQITICDLPKEMLEEIAGHLSLRDILVSNTLEQNAIVVDNTAVTDNYVNDYANENEPVSIIGDTSTSNQ